MRRELLPIPTNGGVPVAYGGVVSDNSSSDSPADEQVSDDAEPVDVEEVVAPVPGPTATPVPVTPEETGYTAGGVPTFDYVREKIETKFGTSIGSAELASETPEARRVEEQYEARQKAATDRLAQIRESMKNDEQS